MYNEIKFAENAIKHKNLNGEANIDVIGYKIHKC